MKFNKLVNLLKEPIVQFIFLGALLFGLDHMLVINRDDPKNVLVDDEQIDQFITIFEDGQGRPPSGQEINNMVIAWAQNEILYREARRMGLDRGDDMIRNRLILKIRNVLFNNVVISDPSEAQLQEFFEFNKAAYQIPARYDVEMIALPGEYDLANAQAVLEQTLAEGVPEIYLGSRYEYQNRRQDNLLEMFGDQGSKTLLSPALNEGEWVLIPLQQRHHLVRITAKRDAVEPSLDAVRSRVVQDYERYAGDTQISDQTYNIARQYQVRLDVSDAYLEKMENEFPKNPFQESPSVIGKPSIDENDRTKLVVDRR